jgi:ATP synthase protein I
VVRTALAATLVAGAVAAVVAALTGGAPALRGVVLGLALLLGFYVVGLVPMQLGAAVAPAASLLLALLTYTFQVVLLALAFVLLQRSGLLDASGGQRAAVDRGWFGGVVVVGTLVWTTALVRGATRERIPLYHTSDDLAKPASEGPAGRTEPG